MPNPKFPGPTFDRVIEPNSDPQIVSVPMDQNEIGGRKISQKVEKGRNIGTVRHVKE